jgi:hypothetical protein
LVTKAGASERLSLLIAQFVLYPYACCNQGPTTGGGSMSGSIFISYRRDDSEGEAGRLYDDLIRIFGMEAVFMDVSDIHPGKDFRQAIDDNVAKCAVLLAMIGPGWTTVQDASGSRRLGQPNDFVRLEIASALTRHRRDSHPGARGTHALVRRAA